MSEEKDSTPKPTKTIRTKADGITSIEETIDQIKDTKEHMSAKETLCRRQLEMISDGQAIKLREKLIKIMADIDGQKQDMFIFQQFMAATDDHKLTPEMIMVVELNKVLRISGKLDALSSELANIIPEDVRPLMSERGKQKFEAKYGKVDDAGKIIKRNS